MDVKTIGIDKGSIVTNSSTGYEILSTVRLLGEDEISLDQNKTVVEFDGKKYVIGENGNFSTDLMKAEHENTPILVYTAIAQSFESNHIETNLVLGLPIRLYARNKEKMKNLFHGQSKSITINGKVKIISIKDTLVYPEAAAAFNNQSEKDGLVFDFGGLSIDVAQFKKGKLIKYSTYSLGLLKLYSKIANKINASHDLSITEWEVKEILEEGIYIYGKKVDIGEKEVIKFHIDEIMEKVKLEYDLKREQNIIFTGGGSEDYLDYLKIYMPQAKLSANARTDNAIGLEKVGQSIFQK